MELQNLFVVGAGTMGRGIAQVGLQAGLRVTLWDADAGQLERARRALEATLAKQVDKGRMTEAGRVDCLDRAVYGRALTDAAGADMVIEAIVERLEAKQTLFGELAQLCRPDTIFGSNTSTISVTSIFSGVKEPARCLGTHFFNPVPNMKLLELVAGLQTSEETLAAAEVLGERMGKVCICSKDSGGFIANRIGSPMLNAAVNLLDAGVGTREDIDASMRFGYGYPMGPLELIDLVGVDVQVAVMEVLYAEFGAPYYKPAPLLRRMLAAGRLGRKTGIGFYDYKERSHETV